MLILPVALSPLDYVTVKLDFNDAFNSLHHPNMVRDVADRLLRVLLFCVLPASTLVFGPHYFVTS